MNRRRLAGIFAATFLLALLTAFILPRSFTATATVVVDPKPDPVAAANQPSLAWSSAFMTTQVDIARSERVARTVVAQLQLDQTPGVQEKWRQETGGRGDYIAWIANNLQQRVSIAPARESGVISISAKWSDAKGASAIANAFAKAYIDTTIELNVEPAKQYAGWFDTRAAELRRTLESKQRVLSDFENKSEITSTDERLDIETARLNDLSTQLTVVQTQRQDTESKEQKARTNSEDAPEVLQNPLIGTLKAELADAEAKEKILATSLGIRHPDYIKARASVSSLQRRLADETARLVSSLVNANQVNVQREQELQQALSEQKQKVLGLKRDRDVLEVMRSDVAAAQRNLEAVAQRSAQSSMEGDIQHTNALLLSAAVEPDRPSEKMRRVLIAFGLFGGILAAVGYALFSELMSPRIRCDEQLEKLLELPLLGTTAAPSRRRPAHATLSAAAFRRLPFRSA